MASEQLKHVVALEMATAGSVADLARAHGYTYGGMRNLVASDEVQTLIRQRTQEIEARAVIARTKLLHQAPKLYDTAIAIASNDTHKDQPNMVRYLLDKLWPSKQVVEQTTTHTFDDDLSRETIRAIENLNRRLEAADPHPDNPPRPLLEGDAALSRPLGPDGANGGKSP